MPPEPNSIALKAFAWLSADKASRMVMNIVAGVVIARCLGPRAIGDLAYALALASLFGALPTLGLDPVLRRELASGKQAAESVIGTAAILRLLVGAATYVFTAGLLSAVTNDKSQLPLIWVACLSFFQPSLILLDLWFQARQRPKAAVIALNCACLISVGLRCYAALNGAGLFGILLLMQLEMILAGAFLLYVYGRAGGRARDWRWDSSVALSLLKDSLPILGSVVAITIYHKIDQALLPSISGSEEAGFYSISVRFVETSFFLVTSLANARSPELIRARHLGHAHFLEKARCILNHNTWLGLALAAGYALCTPWMIPLVYGSAYAHSIPAALILSLSLIFVSQGIARQEVLVALGRSDVAFYCAVLGAIVSVGLNLLLIPLLGASGAAIAFVSAQVCAVFVATWCIPGLRELAKLQAGAFLPWQKASARTAEH